MNHYNAWAFILELVLCMITFIIGVLIGLNHSWGKLMNAWEEIAILKAEKIQANRQDLHKKVGGKIEQL